MKETFQTNLQGCFTIQFSKYLAVNRDSFYILTQKQVFVNSFLQKIRKKK